MLDRNGNRVEMGDIVAHSYEGDETDLDLYRVLGACECKHAMKLQSRWLGANTKTDFQGDECHIPVSEVVFWRRGTR